MARPKSACVGGDAAALVKEMRELCGLSIARTAPKADISAVTLNMFERGHVLLKPQRYDRLLRVLRRELILRSKRMSVVLERHEAEQTRQIGP